MPRDPTKSSLIGRPGPRPRTVKTDEGEILVVPASWELLPPGDAGLTRRVKSAGPTWTVKEKRGRRLFSQGLWASGATIEEARGALERERGTPEYKKKLAAGRRRRDQAQQEYAVEFELHVRRFLDFHQGHSDLEAQLAKAIAAHATPVGSGTVARTSRIPVERRAEAAVIAWLRHQTTAYDHMHIERIKGRRREVRRELAQESRRLLNMYRRAGTQTSGVLESALTGEPVEVVPKRSKRAAADGPAAAPVARKKTASVRVAPPRTAPPVARARAPVAPPCAFSPPVATPQAPAAPEPPSDDPPTDREARLRGIRSRARGRR